MQDQAHTTATTAKTTPNPPLGNSSVPNPPLGHSSVDKLPAKLREAVNKAVADGATIDEITALIRSKGGDCSRSAVGRHAKKFRAILREQRESEQTLTLWMKEFGERDHGRAGLVLIETMRTMVLATMADFAARGEPVPMQELARLSLVLRRIEDTDRLRLARERAAKKEAEKAAEAAKPKPRKGLSPEAIAAIDEYVLGKARWPVRDDSSGNPDESQLIPPNPADIYPEIAPRVYRTGPNSIMSLGPE